VRAHDDEPSALNALAMNRRRGALRRRAALAVLAALAGAGAIPASAEDASAPTVSEVLSRARAASDQGTGRKGEIEQWEVASGGLTGIQTVVRRGRDFSSIVRLGPFTLARGHFGPHDWHQDENGITVVDRGPSAGDRVLSRTVERVTEPVAAYAVIETLANGHIHRAYYDPRTFVLLRKERWAAGHFSYTAWDDFRFAPSGHLQARHYHGESADGNAFDYRLRTDHERMVIDDAALSIPRNRRTVVEFPEGMRHAHLPARIEHGRVYVRLWIGARVLDFLLDSGASGIVVSRDVARQLDLTPYGSENVTMAGSFASSRVMVPQVEVGPLRMHDVVMRTAPILELERRDVKVVGLLGFDFIAGAVLRIDYERGRLDAYEPASFQAPGGATAVDVRLNDQIPLAAVQIGASTGDGFLVDTAAPTSLLMFAHFARAHPADVADDGVGAALASTGIGLSAYGVGGRIGTRPMRVKRFRFGGATFDDPLVYVAESSRALGHDSADGLVGAGVLSRFSTVYLDYPDSRILLETSGGAPAAKSPH
jgi:predicted aspartyl protease